MFVAPRTSKPFVVEENVQNQKNLPPKWKRWAQFEAAPGK
jgi:hypothetical protein